MLVSPRLRPTLTFWSSTLPSTLTLLVSVSLLLTSLSFPFLLVVSTLSGLLTSSSPTPLLPDTSLPWSSRILLLSTTLSSSSVRSPSSTLPPRRRRSPRLPPRLPLLLRRRPLLLMRPPRRRREITPFLSSPSLSSFLTSGSVSTPTRRPVRLLSLGSGATTSLRSGPSGRLLTSTTTSLPLPSCPTTLLVVSSTVSLLPPSTCLVALLLPVRTTITVSLVLFLCQRPGLCSCFWCCSWLGVLRLHQAWHHQARGQDLCWGYLVLGQACWDRRQAQGGCRR